MNNKRGFLVFDWHSYDEKSIHWIHFRFSKLGTHTKKNKWLKIRTSNILFQRPIPLGVKCVGENVWVGGMGKSF